MTNIAMAVLLDPDFENHVKEVTFMGGTFKVSGNQAPRASYNVMVDPEAAKVVYNSKIPAGTARSGCVWIWLHREWRIWRQLPRRVPG
ncbi:MAG: nucleoside hydrolase [Enterocloster bolteae]